MLQVIPYHIDFIHLWRTVPFTRIGKKKGSSPGPPAFLRGLVKDSCEFVAQDVRYSINTGFLVFRAGEFSRKLVDTWVSERERIGVRNDGAIDQIPLQSAVLKLANPEYDEECDSKKTL